MAASPCIRQLSLNQFCNMAALPCIKQLCLNQFCNMAASPCIKQLCLNQFCNMAASPKSAINALHVVQIKAASLYSESEVVYIILGVFVICGFAKYGLLAIKFAANALCIYIFFYITSLVLYFA